MGPSNTNSIVGKTNWLTILLIALPTIAYCVALLVGEPEWIRGIDGWIWTRMPAPVSPRMILPIALVGGWVVWVILYQKSQSKIPIFFFLSSAIIVTGFMPYTFLSSRGDPILQALQMIASPISGSFFGVAGRIYDPNLFLVDHFRRMTKYVELHANSHPPGIPLMFFAVTQLFERLPWVANWVGRNLLRLDCSNPGLDQLSFAQVSSATLQFALPFLAGLGVIPLFLLSRDVFGRRTGLWAVGLYPLIPSLSAFAPTFDQLYVPIALCGLWLVWRACEKNNIRLFGLAGLFVSLSSFQSFGNLAFLGLDGLFALSWLLVRRPRPQRWVRVGLGIGLMMVGTLVVWIIYWVGWGISGVDMYRRAVGVHGGIDRDYWTWVGYNIYDVLSWCGVALWVPIGLCLFRKWRSSRSNEWMFLFAVSCFFLSLDVSGFVLGETARILLFVAPLLMLVGAAGLTYLGEVQKLMVIIMVGVQCLITGITMYPIQSGRDVASLPPVYTMKQDAKSTHYAFEGSIKLIGYRVDRNALTAYWQAIQPLSRDLTVFVQATDATGQAVFSQDTYPQEGKMPTRCWLPGEVVTDPHPLDLPAGSYQLWIGVYEWPGLRRLHILPSQPGDIVSLGFTTIPADDGQGN